MSVCTVLKIVLLGCLALTLLVLIGCSTPEVKYVTRTVQVDVPVYTRATPPPELMGQYKPEPMPVFVFLDDPNAKAALTSEGIDALWMMIADMVARDAAWRAWAKP